MLKFLTKAFLVIALIVAVIYFGVIYLIKRDAHTAQYNEWMKDIEKEINNEDTEFVEGGSEKAISVLATMRDDIRRNSAWCGTMQLIWNDMIDEVLEEVPMFDEENEVIANLNKKIFTTNDLSEEYYYKNFGYKTRALRDEIEKGIKDKFDETSAVLDQIDWEDEHVPGSGIEKYVFYSMLKRDFKFVEKFDILDKSYFGDTEDISYFGIKEDTKQEIKDQVDVLYYNNKNDFAFKIPTKNKDVLIAIRKDDFESSFEKIYYNAIKESSKYKGALKLEEKDELKIPNLDFKTEREYFEVEGKEFSTSKGRGKIDQAFQTIEMKLDSEGGTVKSEAFISMTLSASLEPEPIKEPRYFYCNGEFVLFLIEEGREKPYFAIKIDDIELFQ